jgi:hypothetical protein
LKLDTCVINILQLLRIDNGDFCVSRPIDLMICSLQCPKETVTRGNKWRWNFNPANMIGSKVLKVPSVILRVTVSFNQGDFEEVALVAFYLNRSLCWFFF